MGKRKGALLVREGTLQEVSRPGCGLMPSKVSTKSNEGHSRDEEVLCMGSCARRLAPHWPSKLLEIRSSQEPHIALKLIVSFG